MRIHNHCVAACSFDRLVCHFVPDEITTTIYGCGQEVVVVPALVAHTDRSCLQFWIRF